MKRLIVLLTLATLLASASGCSMFTRVRAQPCETCDPTSSAPLLSRIRLPSISLPWRRGEVLSEERAKCNTCNEGFAEPNGFSEPADAAYSTGQILEERLIGESFVDGQVIDGVIVSDSYAGSSGQSKLYHPEVVGPVSTPRPSYATRYAGELIPAPGSPEIDSAK